jgi:hypothetical protein
MSSTTEEHEPIPGPARSELMSDSAIPDAEFDDLDEILLPRRRRFGLLTIILLVVLIGGLGVLGGVELQKVRTPAAPAATSFASRRAAFAGGGGGGGGGQSSTGQGGGAGGTFGTVKLVDGDTVYLTSQDGSIVKVRTSAAGTTITHSVTGKASDLQPGQDVIVQGSADADGTITATRVTEGVSGGGRTGG